MPEDTDPQSGAASDAAAETDAPPSQGGQQMPAPRPLAPSEDAGADETAPRPRLGWLRHWRRLRFRPPAAPPEGEEDAEHDADDPDGPSAETATFIEHLEELRIRIMRSLLYIVVGAAIAFLFLNDSVIDLLMNPVRDITQGHGIIVTKPAEWFFIWCKILVIAGVFFSIPLILWEIHGFIAPALTRSERAYERWALLFAPLLFAMGVTFGYFVVPIGLRFLYNFTVKDQVEWMVTAENYLGFLLTILLGLGLVFQMPLVSAVLAKLGILKPEFLASKRKHAVVVLMILAAIITPTPDVVNLSIVTVPMLVLFEVSIIVAKVVRRPPKPPKRRRAKRRRTGKSGSGTIPPPETTD
jgi:sec-independent protein translocase protein TatC